MIPVAKTGIKKGDKVVVRTKSKITYATSKNTTTKNTTSKITYQSHVKLGVIGSKSYAQKVAYLFQHNYKNVKVEVKKEGKYYRVYLDFINKVAAKAVCNDMKNKAYIINYYFIQ